MCINNSNIIKPCSNFASCSKCGHSFCLLDVPQQTGAPVCPNCLHDIIGKCQGHNCGKNIMKARYTSSDYTECGPKCDICYHDCLPYKGNCKYGKGCTRKNPIHYGEYSHPDQIYCRKCAGI